MNRSRTDRAGVAVPTRATLAFFLAVSLIGVPLTVPAAAVDVGLYELDGDVTDDSDPGVDAANVRSGTSGAVATTVVSDPVNTRTDIMFESGGGSTTAKDTGDVSEWRWTNKEPGDKLDLIDVLASQWTDPVSGDPFVYIGATRYDGSGASTLGFWFLQDPVELAPGGGFDSIETGAPATHVDGDMLIVADFGGTNLLDIYRWSAGTPVLESTTTLSCLSATATTAACGVSNSSVISSPWPIEQKGYPSNRIGPQAFVELGVNLGTTLGNDLGCYQSIVATSRASDSLTATLNDLALAGVSTCALSIDKTGPAIAAAGETVTYRFEISNDGITPLTLDSVTDDVIGDIATQAAAAGCDSLRGGEFCSFTVDHTVPTDQAAGPLTNTVTATFQPPNGRTTATATDSHTAQIYRPTVTVTKTADLDPANVGATVTYTYVITNATQDAAGTASPAMSVTSVTDDLLGTIGAGACGSLASGESCLVTATDVPDGTVDPLVNTVEVTATWGSVTRTATASESIDVNRTPVAIDDDFTTDEDTVLTVPAPGVVSNDTDPDGDSLGVEPVTDAIDGDLTVGSDGALTFDPAGEFESLGVGESTTVGFDYTAIDQGGLSSTATVEITVTGVNDPVDANPDGYDVDEGQTLTVPAAGVLSNDSDPDTSDTLDVVGFDVTSTGGGTVSIEPDGSFTYTPASGFTGTDTFTYTVSDGNGSSVNETVTITVLSAPDVTIGDATVTEGGDLEFDVTLSRSFSAAIDVTFITSDGSAIAGDDYTNTSVTITFDPGDTSTTVIVPTTDDAIDELDETMILSVASSSTPIGDTTDTGTGTIVDDDAAPSVAISDASASEGDDLSFTISLSNPSAESITIDLDSTDVEATAGSDYTGGPYSVAIPAGDTSVTLSIGSPEDTIDEPSETFTLSVTSTSGGSVGATSDTGTGTIIDDDPAPAVTIGDADVNEGGELSFTVGLSNPSSSSIVLTMTSIGDTATAGDDYDAASVDVTFLPGETSAIVLVSTLEDDIDEADETLSVGVGSVIGTVGDTSDTGTGTIIDDDPAPDVTILDASATEGSNIRVSVTLANPSSEPITVTIGTADGTATAGDDYTGGAYVVTFPAGSTIAAFDIPTSDDLIDETNETIDLSITATTGTVGDTTDTAVAAILDDDGPPTVTIADADVTEGGNLVFDVTLSNPGTSDITLTLTTTDGTATSPDDYVATITTVNVAAGTTAATFTVPTVADSTDESDETLTVLVSMATGPVGDSTDTATGTIRDDDGPPSVTIVDADVTEGGALVFDVTLSNPSTAAITLDLTTTDGSATSGTDYTATSAMVSFPAGATTATFTVATTADDLDEPDETLVVSVVSSTGPVGDTTDTGIGTIADDDATPDVIISDASVGEGGDLVFDVTLSARSAGTVTVTLTTSDGTAGAPADYTATSVTITFDPGETTATVIVPTAADAIAEADETLTLEVSGTTGTLGDVSDTGAGTITDDDASELTISDATVLEGSDLSFTVEISTTSSVDTVVTLETSDGTATAGADYTATVTQVMIAAGNTSATFTVPTALDPIDEPDETLAVSVASVESGFVADSSDTAIGTILDDDDAPAVTIADTTTNEGDSATFTISLSNPSSESIVLEITPSAGTATTADVDLSPVTVTVPAATTMLTFDVPTFDDTIDEPDETFAVGVTAVVSGAAGDTSDTAIGTITDDDSAPTAALSNASAFEGDDLAFTISLSNASSDDITLAVATSDGTASTGDYTQVTTDITIPAGSISAVVTVATIEDSAAELDETLNLTITRAIAGTVVDPTGESGIGTITDDDSPTVTVSDATVAEGDPATFAVTLSNPSTVDTVLVLQPISGTATGGGDFDADPLTITIPAGETTIIVTVATVEDGVAEPTETFTLGVDSVTSGIVGDTSDTGTGTITDDDAPAVTIDDVAAVEGDSLVFTVTLSNPTFETIDLTLTPTDVTATGGADYAAGPVTATFAPGDTTATATIAGIDDTADEADEIFTLSVTGSTGTLGDTSDTGTGTITDDDAAPSVSIGDASVAEGGSLDFPVTLSNPSAADITVVIALTGVTATSAVDYAADPVSVVIPAGATSATGVVATSDDTIDEPTETLTASIESTSGGAVGDTSDTAVGSIIDDDAVPAVTIADASITEGEGLVFDVALSNPSSESISVTIVTTDGTATDGIDYTGGTFAVTFPAGETTGTVTVQTNDDIDDEPDETITLSITGTSGGAVGDTSDAGTGTIVDDDLPLKPNVSMGDASVTEGGDLIFPITLDIPAVDTIELVISTTDLTAAAGFDYTATTTTVTITPGASSASFTVPTTDDADVEADETLTATIDLFTGSAVTIDGTATGTIIDNDAATPDVVIGDIIVSEGDSATFTVSLTAPAVDDVTITIATTDGTATAGPDYTATSVTVTIAKGATSVAFDVPTIEDSTDEPDETFTVAITATTGTLGNTSDTATGSIVDDDGPPSVTIDDASAGEGDDLVFTVTLSNPSTESITVTVVTTDGTATGSDYGGGSFGVTFAPGETAGSATVASVEDTEVEADETFTLSVDSTSGGAVGDTSDVGTGTITDDDAVTTPDVAIGDASVDEGGDLIFPITVSESTTEAITITFSTRDGTADASDYTSTTVAVTIVAGDTTASVSVATTSDSTDEPDETLTLGVASVDSGSVGDISDTGLGTIVDDDPAPAVALGDTAVTEGGDAVIPITLSNPSSDDITITLAIVGGTADGADRPDTAVTVTIPAGATSATSIFPTTADTVDEPDETFIVAVGSIDAGTVGDTSDTGTATIIDDDGALGSITGQVWNDLDADVSIDPGEPGISGVTVELHQPGTDDTFGTGDDVLVDSTTTAGPYSFTDLPFGPYQVRIVSATLPAGFVATGDFDGGTDSIAVVTVVSATPISGVDFGYVDPNDPPSAVDDSVSTIGAVTINVLGNDRDPDGDPLSVDSVTQPNNGAVVVNADGTVTYDPDAGFAGADSFTYMVCDPSGACDTGTVTVDVGLVTGGTPPVNNPPDYRSGFVPELNTVVGGGLGSLPLTDPDGDDVTVEILSGAMPSGIALQPDGTLTGTATVSGTFVLELELCDDGTPIACVLRPLTIVVDQVVGTTPEPPPPSPPTEIETPAVAPPGPVELDELPFTGLETSGLLILGVVLLGAGAVFLMIGRSDPRAHSKASIISAVR